jgi:large repetitive protein
MSRFEKRKQFANWIQGLFRTPRFIARAQRAIRLETLEGRRLMAADGFEAWLGGAAETGEFSAASTTWESDSLRAEGHAAQDLVAFAKALNDSGTRFFGAYWCQFCLTQKQLFQDGAQFLPYIEVTNPDRTPNSIATSEGITQYPTWEFPDGTRLVGQQSLETLSERSGVAIPESALPSFVTIPNTTVAIGSPQHVPVDAYDPHGGPLNITVTSSDPGLVTAEVLQGNRSLRISVENFGDMVFELFEGDVPLPTARVIELAQSGFYEGIIFHRVINNFMIQTGDPTGTGSGGSPLGNFDDQFNLNLQHNRKGVLSFAKSTDDTNNSQFFITEGPQRHLDFNHSVFGQLIEGEAVREAISNVLTNAQDRPTIPIVISSITVFEDNENGLIRLKPTGTGTGTANITVTVTNADGMSTSQTFTATVANDNANGAPFLNPIAEVTTPVNTPVNIQLTATDKENDPVTFSVTKLGSQNFTVTVNQTTGLVTLTPPPDYVGALQFRATVQQVSNPTTSDKTDNQVVTVMVGSASSLAVDLDAGSDTGASNSDNITNAAAPVFNVSGTQAGAVVKLKVGNTVLGETLATGTTTAVTASNVTALGEGPVTIVATQTVNGVESPASPGLSVTFDFTEPVGIPSSAIPSNATVGQPYSVNLSHAEEGQGLVYSLSNAPAGMTIDATTGVINWTPTISQLGALVFNLNLTDVAGNVRTQSVSVSVIDTPKARVSLQPVDMQGNPLTQIATGQQFQVRLLVQDLRGFSATGVFSVYTDLLFDDDVIEPVANNPITYIEPFTNGKSGSTAIPGLIDELGAFSSSTQRTGGEPQVFAVVTFVAKAPGNASLRTESADTFGNDILLFDESTAVPLTRIEFGSSPLAVGANFQVVNDVFNFDEDTGPHVLNVLANDTTTGGAVLTLAAVGVPSGGGSVTIAPNGTTLSYTPAPNFNGAETFTYTAQNQDGVQLVGTVTVQVADVNDPPLAVSDTFSVARNSTLNVLDVLANDTQGADADAVETLSVAAVSAGSAGGTIQVGSSGLNVLYTPATGFVGTETFTYTLSDGRGGTATGSVTVTVNPPHPVPVPGADTFTILEDAPEALYDVLANDTAHTDMTLVIQSVGSSTRGSTVSISPDKSKLVYRPAANINGEEIITYTVRDTGGLTAVGTVTFNITPVNDPPDAVNDTVTLTASGGTQTIDVLANDINVDQGETLTITAVTQPPAGSGTIAIAADGKSLRYTPPSESFAGSFSFTYTIDDGTGLTDTATVNVTVQNYVPRDLGGALVMNGLTSGSMAIGGVTFNFTGTDVLGASVSSTVNVESDGSFKKTQVAPGNYAFSRSALPFLVDSGDNIPVTSGVNDSSNLNLKSEVGGLHARYISLKDLLGSTSQTNMNVAVAPGQTQSWYAIGNGFSDFKNIQASLNSAATSLVITAVNGSNQNVSATVPLTGANPKAYVAAKNGDTRLLSVQGTAADLGFTVTNNSNGSSGSNAAAAEGEGVSVQGGGLQGGVPAPLALSLVGEGEGPSAVVERSSGLGSASGILQQLLGSSLSGAVTTPTLVAATTQLLPGAVDDALSELDTFSNVSTDWLDELLGSPSDPGSRVDVALSGL